ncbi:hypothetical protein DFH29DRAFT_1000285 [Suillus ampliporus]|nr:hypothetical protein DFH29DRAFT_1000285 [Suillus ampliporus]
MQIFAVNTTIYNACIAGDLHTAEELLTQEIDADDNRHDSYANRSVVRARNSDWDNALQDAVKSIDIKPSSLGYVSKGIALCGKEQLWDAVESFDLTLMCLNRGLITVDILLLIKAVAFFNSGRHDEAMRRIQNLANSYQHSDTLPCSIVNLAMIAFEDGRYSEAAGQLTTCITTVTDSFLRTTPFEPRLKIFTVLFGWDLDSLWQIANQRRLRRPAASNSLPVTFKQECTALCVLKGDEAAAASNLETAIELYSAAIALDCSRHSFVHRSKANLERNLYAEALHDAEKVVELDPSSYIGYELKHTALHGAQRYDEAVKAFKIMLSRLADSPDAEIRKLRQQYGSLSEVEGTFRRAIHAQLENAPLRLLNTSTGHLCNREAQIDAFMESAEYNKHFYSSMMHMPLQTKPIEEAVEMYFRWDKVVYDLDPIGTIVKLQTFCKMARNAGYYWAWSDTCCIDQNNNVELQESVNSMFIWYRHSALTIVYLSDVLPSSQSGVLANSTWNTRGWTIQEFLAPNIVLFYQADWTLYLDDRSPNHKDSVAIMQELEHSTGINARALVAFRPGTRGAREKLRWASSRVTTLQEDIAYSLFGIFKVHLPVIYGEKKQNALGRLLQEIIAHSGDITALDWVGKSSEFNSCLPADIHSYKAPSYMLPSLSEDEMQTSVSMLQHTVAMESASKLYALLNNLSAPRFANSRLQLPCIAFLLTEVKRKDVKNRKPPFTYDVTADGLQDLVITAEAKLIQFSRLKPTQQKFLLVRPWNRHDLGLPDFTEDDEQSLDGFLLESPLDDSFGESVGENEPVDLDSQSREFRLMVRLGQPFSALLPAQQHGGEYKRIASDRNIVAQVKDVTAVRDMMNVRTLEIL